MQVFEAFFWSAVKGRTKKKERKKERSQNQKTSDNKNRKLMHFGEF